MSPLKIRHLDDLAVGVGMFILCAGAGAWLSRGGDDTPLTVFGALGLVFLLYFLYTGTKTETISPEGICAKSIFQTRQIPWQQVEKVGILQLRGYYLSITVTGEKKGLLLRLREDLKTVIEHFYGPLDFDRRANDKIDR